MRATIQMCGAILMAIFTVFGVVCFYGGANDRGWGFAIAAFIAWGVAEVDW